MDALISHSSKSYYACVGESTHAYQSPSKDLTAINNRLNGYIYYIDAVFIIVFSLDDILIPFSSLFYFSIYFFFSIFSTRKLRGALNFDDADVGLVSDSLVANSLCLQQNGSCASLSGAPLKSEQPDS